MQYLAAQQAKQQRQPRLAARLPLVKVSRSQSTAKMWYSSSVDSLDLTSLFSSAGPAPGAGQRGAKQAVDSAAGELGACRHLHPACKARQSGSRPRGSAAPQAGITAPSPRWLTCVPVVDALRNLPHVHRPHYHDLHKSRSE